MSKNVRCRDLGRLRCHIFIIVLFLFLSPCCLAAPVTWSSSQTTSGVSDLLTGTPVIAYNGSAFDVTVNGIVFTSYNLGSGHTEDVYAANSSASGITSTGDANFDTLIQSQTYGGGTSTSVVLNGLTSGTAYQVQVFFNEQRDLWGLDSRVMTYGDGLGNNVDVVCGIPGGQGDDYGRFATGSFVADGTTQALALITNGFGNAHFNAILVTQDDSGVVKPTITAQPEDVTVDPGQNAGFTVAATNPETGNATGLSYQWFKAPGQQLANGADYSGANTASLTVLDVQLEDDDNGEYFCRVSIISSGESVDSAAASLVIQSPVGLIGYWKFDDSTNPSVAVDSSMYGNDGTISGATYVADPEVGTALSFDANGDVVTLPAGFLNTFNTMVTDEVSVVFMVYGGSSIASSNNGEAFWSTTASASDRFFCVQVPWRDGNIYYNYGRDCCTYRLTTSIGSGDMAKGRWNMWAFTRNAATGLAQIYYNGQLWDSKTQAHAMEDLNSFTIGGRVGGVNSFDGKMKDFRVYNYVLADTEIEQLYFDEFGYKPQNQSPSNGAVDLDLGITLSWFGSDQVDSYNIYLGTTNPPSLVQSQTQTEYTPTGLDFNTTYYWYVESVVDGESYPGAIWTFTTTDHMTIEDFGQYAGTAELKQIWSDSTTIAGNAVLTQIDERYPAVLAYDNTVSPFYSKIQRTFTSSQNWSGENTAAITLKLRVPEHCDSKNVFLTISDGANSANVFAAAPNAVTEPLWGSLMRLNFDLKAFAQQGVDLSRVQSIAIGIGSGQSDQGEIDIDSVALYVSRKIKSAPTSDLDGSGLVDEDDLAWLAAYWASQNWQVTAAEPDAANLQAHYSFDSPSGTIIPDISGNGRNGNMDTAGADNWVPDGVSGNCLDFDGTFAAYLPEAIFTGSNSGWTISMWLRNNSPLEFLQQQLSVEVKNTAAVWQQAAITGVPAKEIAGQWRHLVFVADYTDNILSLYTDGVLVAENTLSGAFDVDTGQTTLAYDTATDTYWHGQMDELRLYNTPLSHAGIVWLAKGDLATADQFITPMWLPAEPFPDGKIDLLDLAQLCQKWLDVSLWP